MNSYNPYRVLFVCMGNICRSPTAEGVMRKLLNEAGLQRHIVVDSAGTHVGNSGQAPDPRAHAAAQRRGIDLTGLGARQVTVDDFESFDLVLAMDFSNMESMQRLCPAEYRFKIGLLMPYASRRRALIVHDPYHRASKDFDSVLDYIEDACEGLMGALLSRTSAAGQEGSDPISVRAAAMDYSPASPGLGLYGSDIL